MTVHKRGNRWVGEGLTDGRWRWLGTFNTKKEARAAEEAAAPSRASWGITVDAFCERWLTDYARAAPSTRSSYRYALAPFRREFGKRRLVSIERPEAQRWAARAPYFQYRTVRTMYADALRDGLVAANPLSALRIPVPEGRRRITALTESEVKALADKALETHDEHFGPTVRALILTAGFVGLRPGELAALDWSDVELHRSRIHVRRALDAKGNMRAPKNGEPRIVVLPPAARDALASLERQLDEPAVFLTPRGRRFAKGAVHRYFSVVRAAFGRPNLDFYELRHACATLLLERGLSPEDVAIQLGHTDGGALVRRLYGHPSEDRARARITAAFEQEPVANWSQRRRETA